MWTQRNSGLSAEVSDYGNCLDLSYTRVDGKYMTIRFDKRESASSVAHGLRKLAAFVEPEKPEGG